MRDWPPPWPTRWFETVLIYVVGGCLCVSIVCALMWRAWWQRP